MPAPTVLLTHSIPTRGMEALFDACRVIMPPEGAYTFTPEALVDAARDVDAIFAAGPVPAAVIEAARRLRIIANYGAGYDRVDVEAAARRGIPVTNLTRSTSLPTAEMALTLLLSVARRVPELDGALRGGEPESVFGMGKAMGRTLDGLTLGIVGLGNIGSCMARLCRGLGMQVLYTSRHRRSLQEEAEKEVAYRPLEALLAESDVVSLHVPHTAETDRMINAERLALMKPDAILINTARGGVVDTDALAEALRAGRLGGAGLDVYPQEPHVPAALFSCPHTVLTPHIGTNTAHARAEMARETCDCILRAFDGRPLVNVVNGVG